MDSDDKEFYAKKVGKLGGHLMDALRSGYHSDDSIIEAADKLARQVKMLVMQIAEDE